MNEETNEQTRFQAPIEPSPIVDDSTDFPCFIYRGGDASKEVMVCGSKEVENDWAKRGFVRAGHALPDTAKLPIPDAPQSGSVNAMLDPAPKPMPAFPDAGGTPPKLATDPETHAVVGTELGDKIT